MRVLSLMHTQNGTHETYGFEPVLVAGHLRTTTYLGNNFQQALVPTKKHDGVTPGLGELDSTSNKSRRNHKA